jgi:hypothetical protein
MDPGETSPALLNSHFRRKYKKEKNEGLVDFSSETSGRALWIEKQQRFNGLK